MADALRGGIIINEVLVDPNGAQNFDTDGSGTAENTDEYVTFLNTTLAPIDIGGLQLWDHGMGMWFTFPDNTIVTPGGYATVIGGVQPGGDLPEGDADHLYFDAGRGTGLINNGGDNITVLDPAAGEYIQATFNGDAFDNPPADYAGFPAGAVRVGDGEDFGNDTDGMSLVRATDGSGGFTDETPTAGQSNVCFTDGTLIATPKGDVRAETITVIDQVLTRDHGTQTVQWVLHRTWSPAAMRAKLNLAPVLIKRGALGAGLPARDLRVSRQHRIMVTGRIAQRMFDCDEVLVPAKCFIGQPGVSVDFPDRPVTYIHIMLSPHEILISEGLPSESLYLGAGTLKALPPLALRETAEIFDLADLAATPARPFVDGRRASQLLARHHKNNRPIVQSVHIAQSTAA